MSSASSVKRRCRLCKRVTHHRKGEWSRVLILPYFKCDLLYRSTAKLQLKLYITPPGPARIVAVLLSGAPGGGAVEASEAEWSTEGQAGLRARRRAWPSVSIGLVPIIRVVLVDQSRGALVIAKRPRRGDRLITSSSCRSTMGPGRRSVQPDHRRTSKAAVLWGGSYCFPLMAPPVTPDMGQVTILNKFARKKTLILRRGP